MIDVNKITSTLAKLPDAQLQQYAQMHKADPYIMSLAMSESNRRKEMRAASQGAQGMQEQPKVVDQMVAEMAPQQLPEEMGIGQLPAGDMNFASGGIIAFADGGDVPRYQGNPRDGSLVRMPYGQSATNMTGEIPGFVAGTSIFQTQPSVDPDEPFFRRLLRERQETVEAQRVQEAQARAAKGRPLSAEDQARVANADKIKAAADTSAQDMAQFDAASNLYMTERAAKQPVAAPPVVAAPRPDTRLPAGPRREDAPVVRPETGSTDIDALQQKYFGAIDQEVGGLRNARAGLVAGIKDLTEKNLAATKADIAARGDVFKGREERLAKQEKGLEGMGDKYMGLALLQAGAAMMSTPGGLGVALGKGVQVGSERYAAGLDKIEAAKSKFAEARDRLDDLRINRDDMNAKDIRAAEKDARESELKGKEMLYNGLVSDLGVKQKNVSEIFRAASDDLKTTRQIEAERQNTITREGGTNARNRATIEAQLNTPDRLVFNQLLKDNNNDATAAAAALQKIKTEKFDIRPLYAKHIDEAQKAGLVPDTLAAYTARFGAVLPR